MMAKDFRFDEEEIRKGFRKILEGSDLLLMKDFHLNLIPRCSVVQRVCFTTHSSSAINAITPEEYGSHLATKLIEFCLEDGHTHVFPDIMISQYVNYGDDLYTRHFGKKLLLHNYIVMEVGALEGGCTGDITTGII